MDFKVGLGSLLFCRTYPLFNFSILQTVLCLLAKFVGMVAEATLQALKLHVVRPGGGGNNLHFYPWRNVVCKTTAKKK